MPDDATYTFTAPPCRYTDVRGFTLDVVGQLRIVDPAPETAGFGADISLTALRFTLTAEDADQNYSVIRNGTMILTGSPAGLELASDLQVQRSFTGLSDASAEHVWTVGFDPETTLQINQPLPSGTVTVAGTVRWSRGNESFDLTLTTVTPLHYNASLRRHRPAVRRRASSPSPAPSARRPATCGSGGRTAGTIPRSSSWPRSRPCRQRMSSSPAAARSAS